MDTFRCGDCKFWNFDNSPDPRGGMCEGAPPTAIVVPAGAEQRIALPGNNRPVEHGLQVRPFRPMMARDVVACALFKARPEGADADQA